MNNIKQLYESIMKSVAAEVKKALNEAYFDDGTRSQMIQYTPLRKALEDKQYKCMLWSKSKRNEKHTLTDMTIRRGANKSYVKIQSKKRTNDSTNILLPYKYYKDQPTAFNDSLINEICIICPPSNNYDPHGMVVDNTKACFFDIDYIINAIKSGELKIRKNQNAENVVIPESWAKENCKELITYKYQK